MSFDSLVILAAGRSKRAGIHKALMPVENRVWLEVLLEGYQKLGLKKAFVVVGTAANDLLARFAQMNFESHVLFQNVETHLVYNANPDLGSFFSLQLALERWLRCTTCDRVLMTPIDCRVPDAEVLDSLYNSMSDTKVEAAVPLFGDRGGHPVALSRALALRLLTLKSDDENSRLDFQLRNLGDKCRRVPTTNPAVISNMNTLEDWHRALLGNSFAL